MAPVHIPRLAAESIELVRAQASEAYQKAAKLGPIKMDDGRSVALTSVGLKKTRSHSADRRVLDFMAVIREVLATAGHLRSLQHTQKNPSDSIRAWHYYEAKLTFDQGQGQALAKLVVRESVNGDVYYDISLSGSGESAG